MTRASRAAMRKKRNTIVFLMLIAGCAHSGTEPKTPRRAIERYEAFQCAIVGSTEEAREESERRARAEVLRLAVDADSILLVQPSLEVDPAFAMSGKGCGEARDRRTCEAQFAELETAALSNERVFAIAVRGDEPVLYQGAKEVKQLLGSIDTPEEAWLMWMAEEDVPPYECNGRSHSGYRRTPSGFQLVRRWTSSLCRPYARTQLVQHVGRDGKVSRVSKYVIAHESEECMVDESLGRAPPIM